MTVSLLLGDCLETMKMLPGASVQCCVNSPPYYGLRDYGVTGQIGLEETPEAYVSKLVAVFREVRRVLKDDGTLWLNLGDSYAGSGGAGGDYSEGGLKEGQPRYEGTARQMRKSYRRDSAEVMPIVRGKRNANRWGGGNLPATGNLKPKDLIGIPWMVAFALRADGWWLRSDIIWHKPNPMPESVTDRPTKSHEYIFLLTKSARYFYDSAAIAEEAAYDGRKDEQFKGAIKSYDGVMPNGQPQSFAQNGHPRWNKNSEGVRVRNKRDVWTVTTKPYKGAHFATFPPDLIDPCILAGSRPGDTVLDPFNGSGTTGAVSIKHGRNYIGCELNPDYIELTKKRLAQVQPTLSMEAM